MVDENTDFFEIVDNFAKTKHIKSIPIIESKLDFVPKVTIAIPTFKRANLLKEALDSAINQIEYTDYDIIVVDNNPERGCETEQLMNSNNNPRLSYYKNEENIGMFGNWNRCIELTRGEYITILNDDDLLESNYLKTVWETVSIKPNLDALLVGFKVIDSEGCILYKHKKKNFKINRIITLDLLNGNVNPGSLGILFSRKCLMKIGGYDDAFYPSADYMFIVKYLVNFKNIFYINTVLSNYRITVNESKNLTTLEGFINVDKQIRQSFKIIYPFLAQVIDLSLIVIECKQFKALSKFSEEFSNMYISELKRIEEKITFTNIFAFKLTRIICKLSRFIKFSMR